MPQNIQGLLYALSASDDRTLPLQIFWEKSPLQLKIDYFWVYSSKLCMKVPYCWFPKRCPWFLDYSLLLRGWRFHVNPVWIFNVVFFLVVKKLVLQKLSWPVLSYIITGFFYLLSYGSALRKRYTVLLISCERGRGGGWLLFCYTGWVCVVYGYVNTVVS